MVAEVGLDLGDELGVVGARRVEPEHRGRAGGPGPRHRELHPVADRGVLGLARPPDVAGLDRVLHEHLTRAVDDPHRAGGGDLEGLVVRAVLLGLLGHEPDVGHRAHGRGVEGAVGLAVLDDDLVEAGVARVGDDGEGVLLARPSAFHIWPDVRIMAGIDASTITSLGTCRLVMPLSESTMAIGGPAARPAANAASIGSRVAAGSSATRAEHLAEAVVRVGAGLGQRGAVLGEHVGEVGPHGVAEDDRVGDLHHRGLEVDREEHALLGRRGDLGGEERVERAGPHHGGVDHLAGEHRDRLLEHRDRAVVADQLDPERVGLGHGDRLLVRAEVVGVHVRDRGLRVARPGPIECGWLRAYCLTDAGARRSELPSRSTGLTAEPLTRS